MVTLIMAFLGIGVYLMVTSFGREPKVSILKRVDTDYYLKRGKIGKRFYFKGFPFRKINRFLFKFVPLHHLIKDKLGFIGSSLTPEDFLFLKEFLAILGGVLYFYFTKDTNLLFIFLVAFICSLLPELWLLNKVRSLKFAFLKCFPETVDLLGLCIEAGLDFVNSTRWLIEKAQPNPFIVQLNIVMNEIVMGKSKQEALMGLAERVNIAEIRSFSRILIQAERMGTPIREAFEIISEDARDRRIQIGERQALRAPILIIFPLILILAEVVIIVAGPIMIKFMQGNLFKF